MILTVLLPGGVWPGWPCLQCSLIDGSRSWVLRRQRLIQRQHSVCCSSGGCSLPGNHSCGSPSIGRRRGGGLLAELSLLQVAVGLVLSVVALFWRGPRGIMA